MVNKRLRLTAITIGLTLAGVAVTRATIPAPNGVIYGCYTKSDGAIHVLDNASDTCKSNETQLTWNQTGQTGKQGPVGPSNIYASHSLGSASGGSFDVTVKTLSLPQGSWLVGAKVGVLDIAVGGTTRKPLEVSIL